jgi:hypothetical protein
MTCLNITPSAPDTLNQLGGLGDWLSSAVKTVSDGISSVGSAITKNSSSIVSVMDAYGKMQAQKAAAQVAINAAQQQAQLQAQAARGLTGQQAMNYLSASTNGLVPPAPSTPLPSWLLPVGLSAAGLVLVLMLTQKRGGNG